MAQEEPKASVEIDKLLASLDESRRGLEEVWRDLEQPLPPGAPIETTIAPARAAQKDVLRSQAQGEGLDARRDLLRKLFLRLRDERRRLEETRRNLRAWTEDLRARYAMLAQAEAQLMEQRLRHQGETLREDRRRIDEEKLRLERERLAEQQRRLDDDRRRDAAPSTPDLPAPAEEPAKNASPLRPSASTPAEAPPKWGSAAET
ncbi:MAG TPA: hypothetical protein DCZ01_01080 [Elusimicrobia bacterium]|nr:MAG: hypothetical protein A2X37_03180 [Elusimicrobia bacterium GWA2_66_18]OGR70356.1 MAG: hypothetical protein A2X40_04280 [Elusimicrobia bacterium GWC2_65_9]HAZ07126.1 hypothetical protein [Elusimicrobiota bacterium]